MKYIDSYLSDISKISQNLDENKLFEIIKLISTTKKGGDIALDVAEGTTQRMIDVPEQQIRKRLNKPSTTQNYRQPSNQNVRATNTDMATGNKSYCYIGSENGNRRCVEASKDDVCESGKVFPSMQLCINPNLR